VDHVDAEVRMRATNALVVLYGVMVLGATATIPLWLIPGGHIAGPTCLAVTMVAAVSALLVRRGDVDLGLGLFFVVLLLGNLAGPLLGQDARLTAVYVVIPIAIAGVTLDTVGFALVAVASVTIGVVGTLTHPPVNPPTTTAEIVTAGVVISCAVVVTTLLGGWGQRREARRADAEARTNARLADSLSALNAELEQRVAERTEELEIALSHQETLVGQLNELTLRDQLTGLYNRRHIDHELPRLVAAAERHHQPLTMAIADLDQFKQVNDSTSYSVGDEVLRRFAAILARTARSTDLVARYGGEEFLLVLPQTSSEQARVFCERLREEVAAHPWHDVGPGLKVTVSVGLADTSEAGGLLNLVAAADAALHRAKREGRNRVVANHD
jgi:diguanylate cyclase (GGDEF)-like protein